LAGADDFETTLERSPQRALDVETTLERSLWRALDVETTLERSLWRALDVETTLERSPRRAFDVEATLVEPSDAVGELGTTLEQRGRCAYERKGRASRRSRRGSALYGMMWRWRGEGRGAAWHASCGTNA
jgi:hypothetical protein